MSSAHSAANSFRRSGLFSGLATFATFERRLQSLVNTKEVGDAFEILVEGYLHTQPTMQAESVWLVGNVPLRIRKQLNLPTDSKGIDGIFKTRAGEFVPYQVKYRTDTAVLPYGEVSSFLGITERSCKDRVLFTNARELAKDIASRDGLRSVRGTQFHALTKEDFAAIEAWLGDKLVIHERRSPRPYQQDAIRQITETLKSQPRTTAVMACGTGKTLVALWVAEKLKPETVLVLVPSLALLSQTLPDWCKESKWGNSLEYLCVCSDPTVSKGADAFTIRPQDAAFPITTDAMEVHRFLSRKTHGVKVVFSTYQSAREVAKGMKGLESFDFAVFDEAHKTTGPQAGLFAFGLSDKNLPITKRLFLTATPRHYDIRRRDKEGDFRLVSMDDETVYGPVSYRLSFALAVKQGIICPYKIVISVTTRAEVDNELLKHGITLVKQDQIQARWVATQLALARAIKKARASKVITFHSRVALAQEFASHDVRGVSQHLKGFNVFHVNGAQSTADRESLLEDFRASERGLITNARCLTEGVDVPAVDMVAFIDPRRSKVDIAQATGRAMRQSQVTGKTTGYIVVPLFLEQHRDESEEVALERSGFDDIALVISAMQEQDEDLVDIIRQLRTEKGEGKPFNPRALVDRIEVLAPTIALSVLRDAVRIAVVDRLGSSWDEMLGRLAAFARREQNTLVPHSYVDADGSRLGQWVGVQRGNRDFLTEERRSRLQAIDGWVWNARDAAWEAGYARLVEYAKKTGRTTVAASHVLDDGFRLGQWVTVQRQTSESLTDQRRSKLEAIKGWAWNAIDAQWNEGYQALLAYSRDNDGRRVPANHVTADGFRLGQWISVQRGNRETMRIERRALLETVSGWTWEPRDTKWEDGFRHLQEFATTHGHVKMPSSYKARDGFRLGQWVRTQRALAESLSIERRSRLNRLGAWTWSPHDAVWERGFASLEQFRKTHMHPRVPKDYIAEDGFPLGQWLAVQRRNRTKLSKNRLSRLESLDGWEWNLRDAAWEDGIQHLLAFVKESGNASVPSLYHAADGFRLGGWVQLQRRSREGMKTTRRMRLESLPGWFWRTR